MKHPSLTYKAAFLAGGFAFAGVSYAVGTLLYEIEGQLGRRFSAISDYASNLQNIPAEHLLTLVPWLVGTTLLSVTLGYLFDRQVSYRKFAEELQKKAEMLAVVDGLTQVYNHAYFVEQLGLEIRRTNRRCAGAMVLLLLDLDDFKKYNDAHGHLQGDELLKRVARTIRGAVRETDLVARYGGEEFVVIAQGADTEQGVMLAQRICRSIELTTPVTVSIGVASYPKDGKTEEELIQAADQAMYVAKSRGKNQVIVTSR